MDLTGRLPTKPSTVSSSTSMEDLVQIRIDAEVEEQSDWKGKKNVLNAIEWIWKKIRLMTKFASQIAEARERWRWWRLLRRVNSNEMKVLTFQFQSDPGALNDLK